jgi:DNA-binding transcriptional MerR regulator
MISTGKKLVDLVKFCAILGDSMSEKKLIPIGPAAKKAGISRQSLQYYLMVGLLEPTELTDTGRRLFDQKTIERIKLIKKLNDSGYPLRAIRELFMEGRTDLKGSK